ncbi:hypothetical protein [Nocardia sp. NPDC059239]|uniref:hypothetical protein n=1 Tax=Nocardia sp. NPDC059239 TaxID=3346785 RepID=UPI00367BA6BD
MPEPVVTHIRAAVGTGADVVLVVHDLPRAAKWHRQQIRERLDVVYQPARVREIAEKAIRVAALTKDTPAPKQIIQLTHSALTSTDTHT